MLGYCTNYLAPMPEITIYMNCDTRLAINLRVFDLNDNDEFIFAIKNYDYIESPCVFLFRAKKSDIDENGEVIFKIDPDISKTIKPGAFYYFAMLSNAFNRNELTEYKKLTKNGSIKIEYGAHDLALPTVEEYNSPFDDIYNVRLEAVDSENISSPKVNGAIIDIDLKEAN